MNSQSTNNNKKFLRCETFNKKFPNRNVLGIQQHIHANVKHFVCNVCKKRFSSKCVLDRHKHIHTGEKHYICSICNKRFARGDKLSRHQLTHTGEKDHICSICDKRFSRRDKLKQHQRTHTVEKFYICEHCNKKFFKQSHLIQHISKHSGMKPFACEGCKEGFSLQSELIQHKCKCTAKKLFKCEICMKRFYQLANLKPHYPRHTKVKPFCCRKCQLGKHLQGSEKKFFNCNVCKEKFTVEFELDLHKRVHNEEVCSGQSPLDIHKLVNTEQNSSNRVCNDQNCSQSQQNPQNKEISSQQINVHSGDKPQNSDHLPESNVDGFGEINVVQTLESSDAFLKPKGKKSRLHKGDLGKQAQLLMDKTYKKRRHLITVKRARVSVIREQYPALFCVEEVKRELERVFLPGKCKEFLENMNTFSKHILHYKDCVENSGDILQIIERAHSRADTLEQKAYAEVVGSIFILSRLLDENFGFIHLADHPHSSGDELPHIDASSYSLEQVCFDGVRFRIMVEGEDLCETSNFPEAVLCFMATFFIFNMKYPKSSRCTLTVIEKMYLNLYSYMYVDDTRQMNSKTKQWIKLLTLKEKKIVPRNKENDSKKIKIR